MCHQVQSSKLLCLAIFSVASLAICRADPKTVESRSAHQEIDSGPLVRRSDWRKALHAEFKYAPAKQRNSAVPTGAPRETPTSPDIVVLPKYVVRDSAPGFRELERVLRDEEEDARSETINQKLGIRTHTFTYKNDILGYKTLFFVPIAFGAAW
jgi:hypothetical protein